MPECLSMLAIFPSKPFAFHSAGKQLMGLFSKKGSNRDLRNYRLVCLLSLQDTSTRFIIKNKITGHMNNYDILRRSTWILWVRITSHIPTWTERNSIKGYRKSCLPRVPKAFESTAEGFLGIHSGHRIRLHGYLESWLNNRKFKVAVNGWHAHMRVQSVYIDIHVYKCYTGPNIQCGGNSRLNTDGLSATAQQSSVTHLQPSEGMCFYKGGSSWPHFSWTA